MRNEYLQRVNAYLQAVEAADNLRREGVISDEDFARIEPLFLAKYGLFIRSYYRRNDWILSRFRGNMTPTKGR